MIKLLTNLFGYFWPRDADAYVERRAEQSSENLDTDLSVVDLLKSLGQDSSYGARARLAAAWGRAGYSGTAGDNIWLHSEIMRRVANRTFP